MWMCYPLSVCHAWSLHWQQYGRIQLVRGFGSIILPIAGLHCLVNARNRACSAPSKWEEAWSMQTAPKKDVTAHAPHVATWHFVKVENTRTFRQYNWFSFPIFSTYTVAGRLLLLEILYNHFISFWQSLVLGISFNPTGSSSLNNFVLEEYSQVFSHVHKVTNMH